MRIAIDASRAINEKAGIGRYTLELIRHLLAVDQKNKYLLIFSFMRSSRRKEKIIKEFQKYPKVQTKVLHIPGQLKEKMWNWKLPWFKHLLGETDVFYGPSFLEVNLGLKIPQVVTIYDLTTFLFPKHLGKTMTERYNLKTQKACQKVQKIIAISRSTKDDLTKLLKVSATKIEVIYPGKNDLPSPANNLPKGLKSKSYILAVGTIEPRKNLIGLFKAYALLPIALQEKYPLVVAGAEGWNTGETFNCLKVLKLDNKVKFLGFVSDGVLSKLYKETALFVYPSLYEGFGFPVLEALSFGAPVITSNVSSLPEVAGKAAVLVDPNEPKSISNAIQKLLEHKEDADKLRLIAQKQADKFSWQMSAQETLKVFEGIQKQKTT